MRHLLLSLLMFTAVTVSSETYHNSSFSYTITLPSPWVKFAETDSSVDFKNNAAGKKTRILLYRQRINTSIVNDGQTWRVFNFTIYKDIAQSQGKISFIDTSKTRLVGTLPSFDYYATFRDTLDGVAVKWAEYNRFCAKGTVGFMISLLGDSSELKNNFATYRALTDALILDAPSGSAINQRLLKPAKTPITNARYPMLLLNGRNVTFYGINNHLSPHTLTVRSGVKVLPFKTDK